MKKNIFIGVVALGLSPLALAAGGVPCPTPTFNPGVYLGIEAGYGMTGWDNVATGTTGFKVKDEDGFAGRAFVGYDFHPNFAVEAGYTFWFTKPKFNNRLTGMNAGKMDSYPWAIDLSGKIKAHVIDNFGLYAKLGVAYIKETFDSTFAMNPGVDGKTFKKSSDIFNVIYGAGAFYDITPNIMVDLGWTRYAGHKHMDTKYFPDLDLFAVSLSYKFNF